MAADEEQNQRKEGDGEARSGGHQPDNVKHVNRLEAGLSGYPEKGKHSKERAGRGHPKESAPISHGFLHHAEQYRRLPPPLSSANRCAAHQARRGR